MIYKEIGDLIRSARQKKGISQATLGSIMNPPRTGTSIGHIERGNTGILLHVLLEIAQKLEVKPESLLPNYRDIKLLPKSLGNLLPTNQGNLLPRVNEEVQEQLAKALAKDLNRRDKR